jgi:hypothetical protein
MNLENINYCKDRFKNWMVTLDFEGGTILCDFNAKQLRKLAADLTEVADEIDKRNGE